MRMRQLKLINMFTKDDILKEIFLPLYLPLYLPLWRWNSHDTSEYFETIEASKFLPDSHECAALVSTNVSHLNELAKCWFCESAIYHAIEIGIILTIKVALMGFTFVASLLSARQQYDSLRIVYCWTANR